MSVFNGENLQKFQLMITDANGGFQMWCIRAKTFLKYCPFALQRTQLIDKMITATNVFERGDIKMITGTSDGSLQIFSINEQSVCHLNKYQNAHTKNVTGISFSQCSSCFATSSRDGAIFIWDSRLQRPIVHRFEEPHGNGFTALEWNSDGHRLYAGDVTGDFIQMDTRNTNRVISTIHAFDRPIRKFTGAGNSLGVLGDSNQIRIYHRISNEVLYVDRRCNDFVRDLYWPNRENGNTFYSIERDGGIKSHQIGEKPKNL